MSNNGKEFTKQVKFDLLNKFRKNATKTAKRIDKIQQDTIKDFSAVDSGFLQQKTFTQFEVNLSSNILAKAIFRTRGVKYATYVITGTGTNENYGERDYLVEARTRALDDITTDTFKRTTRRGSPNKKGRKIAKRRF